MESLPRVSVVIPMFNEEDAIAACVRTMLEQDYPPDRLEVLVIDGNSTDRSAEIVRSFQKDHPNLRLLHNPRRLTPTSLNLGIREATGEIYVRMDAHSYVERDYVRRCVETLLRSGADNVGGLMRPRGTNRRAEAVALATCSPFGVGGARFHYATEEQYVDTVYLGCYRLEALRSLGGYDEGMVINEDDELNFRLTRRGGRIFLSPAIRSWYHPRASFAALWKQYYRYGKWKVRLIRKHGGVPSLRHLVPGAFVAALIAAAIGWLATPLGPWPLLGIAVPYAVANVLVSVRLAAREGWRHLPLLPPTFAALHLAYGTGFLAGIFRFGLRSIPSPAPR